jgi:hypothetical protein
MPFGMETYLLIDTVFQTPALLNGSCAIKASAASRVASTMKQDPTCGCDGSERCHLRGSGPETMMEHPP